MLTTTDLSLFFQSVATFSKLYLSNDVPIFFRKQHHTKINENLSLAMLVPINY